MKNIDVGQTINTLANLGVIGGLVFVGLQVQQDRDIAAADRFVATEANNLTWAELVANNSSVWTRAIAGEELTSSEYATFDAIARARNFSMFTSWVNLGRPSNDGLATPESFAANYARELAANPGWLAWWRENGSTNDFGQFVDSELERLAAQD